MKKIVTMHQPNYLPWIGLFSKISQAASFVIFDVAQLGNHTVTNRNKIRTNTGWNYLTIPVSTKSYTSKICDVPLPLDKNWQNVHWKSIYCNYVKTEFFSHHKDFFEELYQKEFKCLPQITEEIIRYLLKCFNISVEVLKASEMNVEPGLQKTDLMISCLKGAGADLYLSGPSGRNYIEPDKFRQNNIELKYFKFQHPVYQQRYPGFKPDMSAIDLLFNMGPQAGEIIRASGSIED